MIIGFGCTAQCGKDTAAMYLRSKFAHKAVQVSFADKLKDTVIELFDLTREQCYGSIEYKETIDARYNLSPRQIMMFVGDKLREVYAPVWIDHVFNKTIPRLEVQGNSLFIISDVRYKNEADLIRSHGGQVVRILRDNSGVHLSKDHPSENALLDYSFDHIIENNGSFEDFYSKLDCLMDTINYR